MKTENGTPTGRYRPVLAAAIALALCSPVLAGGHDSTTGQYDSAVSYADYRDKQATYQLRASDLIGRDVRNASNDNIGEIDDLIVSRDGDKVMAVVSVGGFLGLGSKMVAVPYQDLRVTRDGQHVYYNATRDELQQRSAFSYAGGEQSGQAQPMGRGRSSDSHGNVGRSTDGASPPTAHHASGSDIAAGGSDRRATGSETRATGSETRRADNTAHNEGDRAADRLTPFDQSGAEGDVEITRSIRKALVDDDTLGTNAKNVKVITVAGVVTLRGPVASDDEKARILAIANGVAGQAGVQDELEVIRR